MISSTVSRASALVLLVGGGVLLFASDVLLPILVPGVPPTAAWLGQLLGAAWLGVAAVNWLQRSALLGGIYGRSTVVANVALYVISALSMLRPLLGHIAPPVLWLPVGILSIFAVVYAALMLRGPFDPLTSPAR